MNRDEIISRHADKFSAEPMSGCWLWTAAIDKNGYGMLWDGKRMDRAHRLFYASASGQSVLGINVLHYCDTPACVNPSHLHAGTQAENLKERTQRGRSGKRLNQATADHIRLQLALGRSQRWIAEFWGVSQRLVWSIAKGRVWNANK